MCWAPSGLGRSPHTATAEERMRETVATNADLHRASCQLPLDEAGARPFLQGQTARQWMESVAAEAQVLVRRAAPGPGSRPDPGLVSERGAFLA